RSTDRIITPRRTENDYGSLKPALRWDKSIPGHPAALAPVLRRSLDNATEFFGHRFVPPYIERLHVRAKLRNRCRSTENDVRPWLGQGGRQRKRIWRGPKPGRLLLKHATPTSECRIGVPPC